MRKVHSHGRHRSTHRPLRARPIGGTVFLDEIGEVPLEICKPSFYGSCKSESSSDSGSTRTLRTDARLIAATNRDLSTMVEEQKFRSDLF